MLIKRSLRLSPLLALTVCASLAAQIPIAHRSTPSNELYGGYTYSFRTYDHTQDNNFSGGMSGWQASYKAPVLPWIGIKLDASGYYRSDPNNFHPQTYFLLVGPEISQHIGRYNVFVHGLVGTSHLNGGFGSAGFPLQSNLCLSAAIGGGLDTAITRNLAWRVTGDFLHTNFTPGGVETNQLQLVSKNGRASTGVVLRF